MSRKRLPPRQAIQCVLMVLAGVPLCLSSAARSAFAETVATSTAAARLVTLRETLAAARRRLPAVLVALSGVRQSEAQALVTRAARWPSASASTTVAGLVQNSGSSGATLTSCSQSGALCSYAGGASSSVYGEIAVTGRWAVWDFGRTGLQVKSEVDLPVKFDGVTLASGYRIDLLVNDLIVVELKAVEDLLAVHQAQLRSYLKHSNRRIGLLFNFNTVLLKDGIRRVIYG